MRWEIRGRPNSVLERPAASTTATSFQFCRRKRKRIIRLVVCFFTLLFSTFPRSRYSSRNAVKSDGGRRDRFTKPFLSFFFCSAFGVRVKSVSRTLPLHLPSLEVERAKKNHPFSLGGPLFVFLATVWFACWKKYLHPTKFLRYRFSGHPLRHSRPSAKKTPRHRETSIM